MVVDFNEVLPQVSDDSPTRRMEATVLIRPIDNGVPRADYPGTVTTVGERREVNHSARAVRSQL